MLAERNQIVAVRAIAMQQHDELFRLAAGRRHEARAVELGICCHDHPYARPVSAGSQPHIAEIWQSVKMAR